MKAPLPITPFQLASRFVGLHEVAGSVHNPAILGMLQLVVPAIHDDETPWCSAFANYIAWLLALPRSNNLMARSWLRVGTAVAMGEARPGFHIVVLARGGGFQPGQEVINAPGHVGFFAGFDGDDKIRVLAGNQGDMVSVASFAKARVLGVREI